MTLRPEQHLAMAAFIRSVAGKPGGPTIGRTEQTAHDQKALASIAAHRQLLCPAWSRD